MSKHTIFLVHGMGDFTAKWSDDLQEQIRTLYKKYPGLQLMPFDDLFDFVEILYNDEFDKIRERWKKDADEVLDAIKKEAHNKSTKERSEVSSATSGLMSFSASAAKPGFLRTHVLDVAMYRFLTPVRSDVRVSVLKQITSVLKQKAKTSTVHWSVIGHSLGTAVVHDTIHAIYTDPNLNLPSNVARPKLIAMIANVSRIMETDSDPYTSFTHPSLDQATAGCDYLLNARHEWDLFTVPKEFRPTDDWPDLNTRNAGRYIGVEINAIANKNVHDVEHYLAHPRVHIALFNALTYQDAISKEEAKVASDVYEAETPLKKFDSFIKKLKGIDLGENSPWEKVVAGFVKFAEEIG